MNIIVHYFRCEEESEEVHRFLPFYVYVEAWGGSEIGIYVVILI